MEKTNMKELLSTGLNFHTILEYLSIGLLVPGVVASARK
jgi:hypothetical protein